MTACTRARLLVAGVLLGFLPAATPAAGNGTGLMHVSVQVVAPHDARLAGELAMPAPGHVMREDANGRHYYFKGSLDDARDHFLRQMPSRGYTLHSERRGHALAHAMRWQRAEDTTLIELEAAAGQNPTRIRLHVTQPGRLPRTRFNAHTQSAGSQPTGSRSAGSHAPG